MKKIISILSVLLIFALSLTFAACGGKGEEKSADKKTGAVTDAAAEAPTEPDNGIGKTFTVDGAAIEVTGTTDDLSEALMQNEINQAQGKYVAVVLTITDGKLDAGKLAESVADVKLDDYTNVNAIAKGVTIENDFAYAIGTIYVIYDVPEDYDLTAAAVTVPEA